MKLEFKVVGPEYFAIDDPRTVLKVSGLNENQLLLAMEKCEEKLREIYVPLPVCGGDVDYSGKWAWVTYDYGTVYIEGDSVSLILNMHPDGEDRLDPEHKHWFEAKDDLWLDALPFGKDFILPMSKLVAEEANNG